MMKTKRFILVAALAASVVPAFAIVTRDDVPVDAYISLADNPDFAGAMFMASNIGGGSTGTAILISADTILFSAHLLYVPETSTLRAGTGSQPFLNFYTSDVRNPNFYTGTFETPDGPYTQPYGNEYWQLDVASIQVNPLYLSAAGEAANPEYDMAVAKIIPGRIVNGSVASTTFLPAATSMKILDSDLTPGEEITIIGNGRSGSATLRSRTVHRWRLVHVSILPGARFVQSNRDLYQPNRAGNVTTSKNGTVPRRTFGCLRAADSLQSVQVSNRSLS